MNRFEAFEDLEDKWRWRLFAASGRIVATSGESFGSHADAVRAAERVKDMAGAAFVSAEPGIGFKALVRRLIHREETRRDEVSGGSRRSARRRLAAPSRPTGAFTIGAPSARR